MDSQNRPEQSVSLNFLELENQDFDFQIYRRPYHDNETLNDFLFKYALPQNPNDTDDYAQYVCSFVEVEGLEPFKIRSSTNHLVTVQYLHNKLLEKAQAELEDERFFIRESFVKNIHFVLSVDDYGKETVWLRPYFLSPNNQFGFLASFSYESELEYVNKHILIKSLSLRKDGRENKDYYIDQYRKVEEFLTRYGEKLFPLSLSDTVSSQVIWPSKPIKTTRLKIKKYVFGSEKNDASQFNGIKQHGPLEKPDDVPLFCFMYRKEDKPFAIDLFNALTGKSFATFAGMERMFRVPLSKENVKGIVIDGFENNGIDSATQKYKDVAPAGRTSIPIIIFPWSKNDEDGTAPYYRLKHSFLSEKTPTQFVSLDRLKNKDSLKWSTSNIALAIFGKLGGKPWKLVPQNEKCLIIGIGQSHKYNENDSIEKYFAYSVLTDSSGLYDQIRILSRADRKENYLNGLMEKIKQVLNDYLETYDRFVLHTSFKLRHGEMDAINSVLAEYSQQHGKEKSFVVLKFNNNKTFFGYALSNNTMVPYESTCMSLGHNDYLVWFEGVQYHNPTIRRRIARPMHIQFIYPDKKQREIDPDNALKFPEKISYIQDAINLSGANWRGFNAKNMPVSVYYSKLISIYIKNFDRLGLEEIDIEGLPPWFL